MIAEPTTIVLPTLHSGQREVAHDLARFRVLACGRRWGKTRLGALLCFESALRGGRAWWVAPSYKVAAVGWRQIKQLGRQVPGVGPREGERLIEIPGRGSVQVRSADEPDSLRGEGLDFLVMDECAFISEPAWAEALRPALSDRRGRALFISTPKGMNWFWRAWVRGDSGQYPEWRSWRFDTGSNPFIAPEEIEAARLGMPHRVFRQEYLAEFIEEAGGVFRGVTAAIDKDRNQPEPPKPGRTYAVGVDLARVQDYTVITVLDSLRRQVYHERFNGLSWERQTARIAELSRRYHNAPAWIDSTGVGDPPFESLRKAAVPVHGYVFTNSSKEQLIDSLAIAIEGGKIELMDIPEQTTELLAYQYELTPSRNVRMNAPEGMHDDCVIALALASYATEAPRAGLPRAGGERGAVQQYEAVQRYVGHPRGPIAG